MAQTPLDLDTKAHKLRTLILNARKPFVLRNFKMNWKCFEQSLEEWCANYDREVNSLTEFEVMPCNQGNNTPHWERCRESIRMSLSEFLEKQKTSTDKFWIGLNYQRMNNLPNALKEGIDFSRLGFSETTNECNYWLCSKQTNTPCHYDTYGCNIVVQVYGRKSWVLFPPNTPLSCTRVPYEESSVYCEENLYAPNPKEHERLSELHDSVYRCILNANDVLIVPRHWWHYVEAVDVSYSINYWIPLENDIEEQLKECIVKILIERFVQSGSREEQNYILNPNQLNEIESDSEIFEILEYLYKNLKTDCSAPKSRKLSATPHPYQYLSEQEAEKLIQDLPEGMIERVSPMQSNDYEILLKQNAKRFSATQTNDAQNSNPLCNVKRALLNSVCAPSVIEQIKMEFFRRNGQ
ncbi:PREDICTED: HSPB1-associated protein 1 [Bactrocera latifrons]|uniref:HSPB1-associated protein 1 n=1 Tax=Bactrocera latifrons TaxID=174628 RepID=UPI0008DE4FE3|nr:PREDICTED: HSPB1-associated protein 1 [Bactrocera latifrons]